MSDHGHSALAARQNTRGETTNRATAARVGSRAQSVQRVQRVQSAQSVREAQMVADAAEHNYEYALQQVAHDIRMWEHTHGSMEGFDPVVSQRDAGVFSARAALTKAHNDLADAQRAAARTRGAKAARTAAQRQGQPPDHLTQPIRSAAEAKAWLAAHAGVEVEINNGPHRSGWIGPTAQREEDALGIQHRVWLDGKSDIIQAAKGIQSYMRAHPAGTPDAYQTTREGAYRVSMRNIQAEAHNPAADAQTREAAAALADYFKRHDAVFVPYNFAQEVGEYDANGRRHDRVESPSQQLARFKREQRALALLPRLAPQVALRAGFQSSMKTAEDRLAAKVRDAQFTVKERADRVGELVTRLRAAVAEQRDIYTPEYARSYHEHEANYLQQHQAAVLRGQKALLQQMEKNPEALPTPIKAPKRESAAAQEARAIADHVIYTMWTDAVQHSTSYRDYQGTGRQRYSDDLALTRTENGARFHGSGEQFKPTANTYDSYLKAHSAARAAEATARGRVGAQGHPMIDALKSGQSLLVRQSDGSLRVLVPAAYAADQHPEAGGAFNVTTYEAAAVTHGATSHVYTRSTTPSAFYREYLSPETPAANHYTLVGAYKSKVAAFNALRSQPEHAPHLFEAARRNHLYATQQLEEAKAKVADALARAKDFESWYTRQGMTPPPIEQSNGVKAARKELLTAERRVAKAEANARTLERLMEQTGQRPKTPRAPRAPKATRKAG